MGSWGRIGLGGLFVAIGVTAWVVTRSQLGPAPVGEPPPDQAVPGWLVRPSLFARAMSALDTPAAEPESELTAPVSPAPPASSAHRAARASRRSWSGRRHGHWPAVD